jgi:hypothetical protein
METPGALGLGLCTPRKEICVQHVSQARRQSSLVPDRPRGGGRVHTQTQKRFQAELFPTNTEALGEMIWPPAKRDRKTMRKAMDISR